MRFLADMALFVELANTRHFGRAAAALGIPTSTLSRRVAALEKELGISLVNRSTRSFALTEAGRVCYQRAEKLVAEAKRLHEEVGQNPQALAGHIRIGLPEDLAVTIFSSVWAEFTLHNPGVSLEVLTIHGHPNLLAEALDVAFLVAHQISLPDSSHATRKIGSFARYCYASKLYLKRSGLPEQPSDLKDHKCLLFSLGTLQRQWELSRHKERQTVTVNGVASANSVGLLAQFAREHLGIAILPRFLARHPTFGAGLERVLPEWEAVPAHVFAITASRIVPAKIAKLLEVTKSSFEERLSRAEGADTVAARASHRK